MHTEKEIIFETSGYRLIIIQAYIVEIFQQSFTINFLRVSEAE